MKRNSILLALSVVFAFGCAHKGHEEFSMKHIPADYIGAIESDGRFPAQAGGSGLLILMEKLGGETASVKTVKYINESSHLGISGKIKSLEELSGSQKVAVLEEFSRSGSALRALFSSIPNVEGKALDLMKQSSSVITRNLTIVKVEGMSLKEMKNLGLGGPANIQFELASQVLPVKIMDEIALTSSNLRLVNKTDLVARTYTPKWILGDLQVAKLTNGEYRLFGTELCKNGTMNFGKSTLPVITEVADEATNAITLATKNGKVLSEAEMGGLMLRSHKKIVGKTCLGTALSLAALTGGEGGSCPLFNKRIGRAVAEAQKDLKAHCK